MKDRLAALEASGAELEAPEANVIALHPAAPRRYRELIDNLAPVLASGDTAELVGARNEFRKLLKAVVVTPREERGQFDGPSNRKRPPWFPGAAVGDLGCGDPHHLW